MNNKQEIPSQERRARCARDQVRRCAKAPLLFVFTLQDPGYATFLFEQLQRPGSREAAARCCQVCSTPLHRLRQEALQTLHATIPILTLSSDMTAAPATSFMPQPARFTASSSGGKHLSKGQPAAHSVLPLGERHRAPGWSQSPSVSSGPQTSVQVTVAGGQISGSLSSVTGQAQQYLEGMWSVSKVNNFIPQPVCLCRGFLKLYITLRAFSSI